MHNTLPSLLTLTVLLLLLVGCSPAGKQAMPGPPGPTAAESPPSPTAARAPSAGASAAAPGQAATPNPSAELPLPAPRLDGPLSLEQTLHERRSVRGFSQETLSLEEISQLLWAAQGITDPSGKRTAPSAGALYPLELYVVSGDGFYHYRPAGHLLLLKSRDDLRPALYRAALQQEAVLHAPTVFVITAVYERTEAKYGPQRSPRYVHLEAGHAAQNLLLQAVALGLGSVPIGAFADDQVQAALNLPGDHAPLYLIPVGHPQR
jgi:SagB-type dehydrogenase family enzyme